METVKVIDGRIGLPSSVVGWIGSASELSLFIEGDTMILKKMRAPALSEFAARVPEDEMPLDEVVAEVHRYRQEKRHAGRS